MRRHKFIALLGGRADAWLLERVRSRRAMPVIGVLLGGWVAAERNRIAAIQRGLGSVGS